MKKVIVCLAIFISSSAYAETNHGRSGTSGGQQMGGFCNCMGVKSSQPGPGFAFGAQSHGAMQSGSQGGSYFSPRDSALEDNYQPWPEAEMRQFQKE